MLIARLRQWRGLSQLRLAEQLCEVSRMPTVTRHEVSRWERGERIPGSFWLRWLARTLDVPLERLEAATAQARHDPPVPAGVHRLLQAPTSAELCADLDHARTYDLPALAHGWLTRAANHTTDPVEVHERSTDAHQQRFLDLGAWLRLLRRAHDHLTGHDLLRRVRRGLDQALHMLDGAAAAGGRQELALVAGYAHLAGWVHSDSGDNPAARRAYRTSLRAAAAADDHRFVAYVLASASHHTTAAGDPYEALLLARTGLAGLPPASPPPLRLLLQQRIAHAAAAAGHHTQALHALQQTTTIHTTAPGRPDWLYWLTEAELAAMTGRCLTLLGRPLRAIPPLAHHCATAPARTAAVYTPWLARCYHQIGETEHAHLITRLGAGHATASGATAALDRLHQLRQLLLDGPRLT